MGLNYQKQFQKDYENLVSEVGDLKRLIKNHTSTVSMLNETISNMNSSIEMKDNEIQKLILEIERLKNNNDKNSSNSGKPTSKDGFKKVIHNSREKSEKKPGGQNGHNGFTSDISKIKQLIDSGNVKHEVIDVNVTLKNKGKSSTLLPCCCLLCFNISIYHQSIGQKNIKSNPNECWNRRCLEGRINWHKNIHYTVGISRIEKTFNLILIQTIPYY